MGVYDRDYYREEQRPPGVQFGGHMLVTKLVIITAALYLVNKFVGRENWLMLEAYTPMAPVGLPLWVARSQASPKQVVVSNSPLLQATLTINGSMLALVRLLMSLLENTVLPQDSGEQ